MVSSTNAHCCGFKLVSAPMNVRKWSHQNCVRSSGETWFTITRRNGTGYAESSASERGSVSAWASTHSRISLWESGNQPHDPPMTTFVPLESDRVRISDAS